MRYNPSYIFTIICILAGLTNACTRSGNGIGEQTYLFLNVRPSAAGINTDMVTWEDRVDELRMIAFDSESGEVEFNQMLYFPLGFNASSRAVAISPGTYDFYFFANENVYAAFSSALEQITNVTEFDTDPRFRNMAYNPNFIPDETSPAGRFVMSAIYEDITVVTGGSENNPLPLPIPGGTVELIRALAKVEVVFRKRVAGSSVPENTVTSVELENVASTLSVPPVDNYYTGTTIDSNPSDLTGLNYANDSIGAVTFYIPEFLVPEQATTYTEININNSSYPLESDAAKGGLTEQRRTIDALSDNSVIRNYHYIVNAYLSADGGIQIMVDVKPWKHDEYIIIFQGDLSIVLPPVIPTDSSIIIPTECGRVEIMSENEFLSQGLRGAYNDEIVWYDPETGGPLIRRGDPPYYCEQKYGAGWRLINHCELLTFLGYFDTAYNVWMSNTWDANSFPTVPYYPLPFRQAAQQALEALTGVDLSGTVLYDTNNWQDTMPDQKLGLVDDFLVPGDILIREDDYPNGWPFEAPPGTNLTWMYNEVAIQVKVFFYPDYISPAVRSNWDEILYQRFEEYTFSSTVSRCVRPIED